MFTCKDNQNKDLLFFLLVSNGYYQGFLQLQDVYGERVLKIVEWVMECSNDIRNLSVAIFFPNYAG